MLVRGPMRDLRDWTSDSRNWAKFKPRPGDVVVATSPKCGTTWTQRIVGMLLRQSAMPFPVQDDQPWIDMRGRPIDETLAQLDAQTGRRCIKTHTPLDAIPLYDNLFYIHVARDPRDACMSWLNHVASYTPLALAMINHFGMADETIGRPWPVPPTDPRDFFRAFLRVPEFAPFQEFTIAEYCNLENSYWDARRQPNFLLVHYNDLKSDLEGEMRRIAAFCGIQTPEELWPELVAAAEFSSMKRDADALMPSASIIWEGGGQRFLNKGTNQRWREFVAPEDLDLYEAETRARMSPSLKAWCENGQGIAGNPILLPD